MVAEPITLFARIANPAAVARRLRELTPRVELDGQDDGWTKAVVTFAAGDDRRTLTLTHDPDYYAEPNWSRQMSGLREWFSRLPDTDRKPLAMMLPSSLHFALGTIFEPDFDPDDDPRVGVLLEIAQLLDGVLFTLSWLLDAHGRILFGMGGAEEENPDAAWPTVIAAVSVSDPIGAAAHDASRPRPPGDEKEERQPANARESGSQGDCARGRHRAGDSRAGGSKSCGS